MAPPFKSHLANERTFLEWTGMAIVLGTVSTGLLSMETAAAQGLGALLAPSPVIFLLLSLRQFNRRRDLLNAKGGDDAEMTSTTTALLLGCVLLVTQFVVLIFDVQGSLVHL